MIALVATRASLLALIAANLAVANALSSPLALDRDTWQSPAAAVGAILLLAAFGLWTSLGGKPAFAMDED